MPCFAVKKVLLFDKAGGLFSVHILCLVISFFPVFRHGLVFLFSFLPSFRLARTEVQGTYIEPPLQHL